MEDLRITRLVINNVGVFEHLDLSFKKKQLKDKAEIHIFTGENGTGKTTLLEALTYFDTWFNISLRNENEKKNRKDFNVLFQKQRRLNSFNEKEFNVGIYFNKKEMEFHLHGHAHLENVDFLKSYYENENKDLNYYYHSYNFFAYNGHRQLRDTKVEAFKNFEFNPITEALTFDKKKA